MRIPSRDLGCQRGAARAARDTTDAWSDRLYAGISVAPLDDAVAGAAARAWRSFQSRKIHGEAQGCPASRAADAGHRTFDRLADQLAPAEDVAKVRRRQRRGPFHADWSRTDRFRRSPMRLSTPRIAPLGDDDLSDEQREALAPMSANGQVLNVYRTLARAPKAFTRFQQWGGYVLSRRNSLPAREREIVILRVGFLCKSCYEFTQHTRIGLREGLTQAEIGKIKQGVDPGWSDADAALILAADDLM